MPREDRRAAVVRAAMGVFAARGFRGTRTAEIAKAASVSEATIFKLFPDKEGLYEAILDAKLREGQALPEPAAEPERIEASLEALARNAIERIEADPSFMRLLLFSALEGAPLARMFRDRRISRRLRALAAVLAQGTRSGLFAADPAAAACAFQGMVIHFLILRQIFREPTALRIPRARMAREIVRIFMRGIAR